MPSAVTVDDNDDDDNDADVDDDLLYATLILGQCTYNRQLKHIVIS